MTQPVTVLNPPDHPHAQAATERPGTSEADAPARLGAAPCNLRCQDSSADHPQKLYDGRPLPARSTRRGSSSDLGGKCKPSDLADLTVNSEVSRKFYLLA